MYRTIRKSALMVAAAVSMAMTPLVSRADVDPGYQQAAPTQSQQYAPQENQPAQQQRPAPYAYIPPPPPTAVITQPPAQALPVPTGTLTDVQLGAVLRNMGYEPKPVANQTGGTTWVMKVDRGDWHFNFNVSVSQDKQYIWFYEAITKVGSPQTLSPTALLKLIAWNADNMSKFSYEPDNGNRLVISRPVPNHEITTARIRSEMENFLGAIQSSEPYWSDKSLAETTSASAR